jgi:hypothetical protein
MPATVLVASRRQAEPERLDLLRELDELAAHRRLRGPVADLEPELEVVGHLAFPSYGLVY